jgi:hypothetical protein
MAAPNIVGVTNIIGNTAVQSISANAAVIVENTTGSNKVYKVNTLYISNIDGTNNVEVSIDLFRSNVSYYIGKTIVVPADATLEVINKPIYLIEGDALRLQAGADNSLQGICSFEEIS